MKNTVLDTIEKHKKLLAWFEENCVENLVTAAEMIINCLKQGGCIYICGNGGSAADAQHIAGEFVGRFMRERKALPAVALTTDTSIMTAVANDYSFDDIFTRQVDALVGSDDLLWAFSTSGKSPNVTKAAQRAKERGAKILAFTGKLSTQLEDISDMCISLDAANPYSAQEIHQIAYHIICNLVEKEMCE